MRSARWVVDDGGANEACKGRVCGARLGEGHVTCTRVPPTIRFIAYRFYGDCVIAVIFLHVDCLY